MKWVTIAEGTSPDDLHRTVDIESLPHNTPFKVIIRLKLPTAKAFDFLGAEWVASKLYSEAGAILEDVEAEGWSTIIMHMRANAVPILPLLGVLAAILMAVSFLIAVIKVDAPEEIFKAISSTVMWAVLGLLIIIIAYAAYQRGAI